ncbi:MAG: radical SAM protein [Candidatus Mcinerneyibacterium aminivorans]|uniref:Radical SAM protein n=1 Tax=Candidatus Mcinerneyibacterium aminivorans TaxID=2703815 RepID=A0A5D0MI77_9BACT|nr:MAG: radical SAM protein [Candidatus Mcinerneyibacterium aminivorans]
MIKRIPLKAHLELTNRCNLNCIHCYVSSKNFCKDLATKKIKKIIDNIVDSGGLYLTLSGGECLIRKDFKEIYLYAKTKGLFVSVLTNGTLITKDLIKLFNLYPPRKIEISMYGMSKNIYDKIICNKKKKNYYKKIKKTIFLLKEKNFNCELNIILLKENIHQLELFLNFAEKNNISYNVDSKIVPSNKPGSSPLDHRISVKNYIKVKEKLYGDIKRYYNEKKNYYEKKKKNKYPINLWKCNAGLKRYNIDYKGYLSFCVHSKKVKYDVLNNSIKDIWYNKIPEDLDKIIKKEYFCNECQHLPYCPVCPNWILNENHFKNIKINCLYAKEIRNRATK